MVVGISIPSFQNNPPLSVISVYNGPKNNVSNANWDKFIKRIPPPIILGGDFNVQESSVWFFIHRAQRSLFIGTHT